MPDPRERRKALESILKETRHIKKALMSSFRNEFEQLDTAKDNELRRSLKKRIALLPEAFLKEPPFQNYQTWVEQNGPASIDRLVGLIEARLAAGCSVARLEHKSVLPSSNNQKRIMDLENEIDSLDKQLFMLQKSDLRNDQHAAVAVLSRT